MTFPQSPIPFEECYCMRKFDFGYKNYVSKIKENPENGKKKPAKI
jgi:hypothetical protein